MLGRNRRRHNEFFAFGRSHFNVADPPAGGGATPPPVTPPPNPDLIPRAEARAAFAARDAAKAEVRALATAFGLDPDVVKIVKTEDAENPYKLEGDGVDETLQAIAAARQGKRSKSKWEDEEKVLTTKFTRQLQTAAQKHQQERAELEALIRSELTVPALRAAFAQEGAIDHDGKGSYADLIELTKGRVKVEIVADEATGKFRASVTPLNADGTPLLDPKTQEPVGLRQLAANFLGERPHMRAANFRRGPGAGGRGAGAANAGGSGDRAVGGEAAAAYLFGTRR